MEVIKTQAREFIDLNSIPYLPYNLIDMNKYLPLYKFIPTFNLMTSRGCINRCSYCYNQFFNTQTWRSISPENTVNSITMLYREYGIRSFYFVDDNFLINVKRALNIASLIEKLPFKICWQIQGVTANSLLKLGPTDLKLLENSGLIRISVGVESGSEKIVKLICKPSEIEDVIKINKILSNYNIVVYYSFICGFPNETIEDLKKSIALAFKLIKDNKNARTSPFYIYTPFPNTPLYEQILNLGFKSPKTLSGWSRFDHNRINLDFFSKNYKKILIGLNFVSLFIDNKFDEYTIPIFLKIIIKLYKPIARFRMKRMKFSFLIERLMMKFVLKLKGLNL